MQDSLCKLNMSTSQICMGIDNVSTIDMHFIWSQLYVLCALLCRYALGVGCPLVILLGVHTRIPSVM